MVCQISSTARYSVIWNYLHVQLVCKPLHTGLQEGVANCLHTICFPKYHCVQPALHICLEFSFLIQKTYSLGRNCSKRIGHLSPSSPPCWFSLILRSHLCQHLDHNEEKGSQHSKQVNSRTKKMSSIFQI